ncbi:efflux RND transporter permease subunit [endosymbiont of unidentified scaly snail isolate Monju]|uniref:efflux RND transporter permease subunit n=1 Tax=endosymbiont of unidentified scaly snail isolate Monju TaxID=1248727 RepID=UPI0009DE6021|nr:efflux RND transporter permease subunit [endosymbiont of unidentified scaly snail isolate Monju]
MKRIVWILSLPALCLGWLNAMADELPTAEAVMIEVPRVYHLDGVVEAVNASTVAAQTNGQVKEVLFDVDDLVEAGSVIVVIDDSQQQAALAAARAGLKQAQALASHHLDPADLRRALQAANSTRDNIEVVTEDGEMLVQAGVFLSHAEDLGGLVVGVFDGRPVYLRDVATIREGADTPRSYVWIGAGPHASQALAEAGERPAVTIAIAEKPGTNAVDIANAVIERFEKLKGIYVPDGVEVEVTRNYGATADAKAKKLISKLIFATASVVLLLVFLTLGWREAVIVGAAVIVTLLITLFASWAWGFTLNRVSLFALIFSIGILVDDAIVVVENIHRHMSLGGKKLLEAIPQAVDEVGGPTILATFTVIAALLPMAFVTGLMGPYMSPIPINASMGMLISLVVAFVFTPWLSNRLLTPVAHRLADHPHDDQADNVLSRFFGRIMSPFLEGRRGWRNRWLLLFSVLLLIGGSVMLVVNRTVVMKMLPFDNKSEFQVVLDMAEGTTLERTAQVLGEMADYLATVPEVADYQVYAGTSAPISFNGLVRQYYLREGGNLGDIQVNLIDKHARERKSHEIALAVREPLQAIARRYGGNAKIVEVPPGPPVLSPLVAEVYGLDYAGQVKAAKAIRKVFESTRDIVDVDDSVTHPSTKGVVLVGRAKAAKLGIPQSAIVDALGIVLGGEDMTYIHAPNLKYAVPVRVRYSEGDRADLGQLLSLKVRSQTSGKLVPLSEVVRVIPAERELNIYHKDMLPVVYVTGDMAGPIDSPLYGMFAISERIGEELGMEQWFLSQPENPYDYSIKWDGEWQVTYETFRDMGIAYSVGLVLIYLLVVAQFRSYLAPLVIMAPIPLTVIGILPGHALLGAQFTATSMIGMIALAGIIVRNSILLVDFINQQLAEGIAFERAVVQAAAVRAKPIALTALAAMAGGFFILDDPIFSGLAVSLIFGLLVSTVLTLVVIPVVYYGVMCKRLPTLLERCRTA